MAGLGKEDKTLVTDRVKRSIKRYDLIRNGDVILVGVSGGPDSVCLLYCLNSFKKELRIALHVAHVDHMLREDSGKDREFVDRLCGRLNIPISSAKINIRAFAKTGSIEEAARKVRLDFFFRTAKKIKADKIALGHNLDDQAETVLMRILRGTGLYGLSGILPKRNFSGHMIIRPLIEVRRKEIESFLKRRGIKPRIDASNKEDTYFRNRIRNKLMPLLEKEYNSNIKEILANMAESVAYDYDYLNQITKRAARRMETKFNLKNLAKLHPALQRLLFRNAISALKGDTRRITFRHIREIEDLILNRPPDSIVDLPKGISALKKKNTLIFCLAKR
jgi:tRNA(Ile)-lysidine synthase